MNIKEKLNNLPKNPGVYIMKDAEGTIIYVGKAKNLKNRVSQYFNRSQKEFKVSTMVGKIADFEYILTNSEYDAFLLENNLIKKYMPHYNILLKDGKEFAYIKIDLNEAFPLLEITRKLKKDGSRYFGPYFDGVSAGGLLKAINFAYPIRSCAKNLNENRFQKRECLNYSMNLCSAPCVGKINKQEYKKLIDKVIDFLNGKDSSLYDILQQKMNAASNIENFELALEIRDRLLMLDKLKRRAVATLTKGEDIDVFAFASNDIASVFTVLIIRGGKMMGAKNFSLGGIADIEDAFVSFLTQYYNLNLLPKTILLSQKLSDTSFLEEYLNSLAGMKIEVLAPERGIKSDLIKQAIKNAEDYLENSIDKNLKENAKTTGAMQELQLKLGLNNLPNRIEAFDISNTGGSNSVASMVVFIDGKAANKHYRRFKIKTVVGPDDYASLQEVVARRLEKLKSEDISFSSMPELILIDGGKGQVSATRSIIKGYNSNIDVIGLAEQNEEIFAEDSSIPIILSKNSYALKLLQAVRDEAHRFALTFHRSLRKSSQTHSALDEIAGIGKAKKKALLIKFKSLKAIKESTVEELMMIKGITAVLAQDILNKLNNN